MSQPRPFDPSMRNTILSRILVAAALAFCCAAQAAGTVAVRLIGINDFHGNLEPAHLSLALADPGAPAGSPPMFVPTGGAAALAGLVKSLRSGAPHSVVLGAGDLIGAAPLASTLFRHESTIAVLNGLGLELSALGNHEFDAGVAELKRVIAGGCARNEPGAAITSCIDSRYRGTRFRYLAANVVDTRGHAVVAPYAIRYFEGIPIGFIGAVTRTTPQMVTPSGVKGVSFLDEADAANRAAHQLRARGVKAIVAIFHEGLELGTPDKRGDWNDTACPAAHGALLDIAQRLEPEIRVVFSGHTHQGYRCEIGDRLLIQGTSFGRGVSVVDVELDKRTHTLAPVRSINLPVLNERTAPEQRDKLVAATPPPFDAALREARPDAAIARRVEHYASLVKPIAERPVGRIGARFSRDGTADTAAGRLLADAQLAATRSLGARIAFMNPGGIRANLECRSPPCTVTYGEAFTAQPFGNSLVVMTLTGEQVKALLEEQQKGVRINPRFLQPSEGFTYTWQSGAAPGSRVTDMKLDGEPVDPAKQYRVTVNSFLAEGGDGFEVLKDGTERTGGGQDIDALVAYLGAADRSPVAPQRITREDKGAGS